MTYMYRGQRDFGLDLVRSTMQEVVRRGLREGRLAVTLQLDIREPLGELLFEAVE